ncbi:MAG: hypothetical protein J5640_03830 [Bacteroidales bacterium]|nr:hypothetical protein [Bacteroidales bacterium]
MNKSSLLFLCASAASVLCACSGNQVDLRPVRSEFINVYEVSKEKTVDNIQVPFEGVQDGKIHVLSNVSLEWKYYVNQTQTGTDWFQIKSVEEVEPGHVVVTYDAASILPLNSIERRSGHLSLSCPSQSMGKFLPIRQGYELKFVEDFSSEPGECITITGDKTYITKEYPTFSADYYDYISFNAWAETTNEFLSKNITLDITVSGGMFYETGLTTYRVNVPLGTAPDEHNLKYLLLVGNGQHMSPETKFTFSTANDDEVYVHIDNFSAYKVTEAEMGYLFDDEEFEGGEDVDWI